MNKQKIRLDFWTGVTVLSIAIFSLFLIYPLFSLFVSAFQNAETGAFSLEHFVHFFQRKYYYQSMINSFSVTLCVTVLAILIGTALAYFMTKYKIKGKNVVEICIIISLLAAVHRCVLVDPHRRAQRDADTVALQYVWL